MRLEVCGCGSTLTTQLGQDGSGRLWHHRPKEHSGEPQTLEGNKENRLQQAMLFHLFDQQPRLVPFKHPICLQEIIQETIARTYSREESCTPLGDTLEGGSAPDASSP